MLSWQECNLRGENLTSHTFPFHFGVRLSVHSMSTAILEEADDIFHARVYETGHNRLMRDGARVVRNDVPS